MDDQLWSSIIEEVDNDGNGEIDFEEFCFMMNRLIDDPGAETLDKGSEAKKVIN